MKFHVTVTPIDEVAISIAERLGTANLFIADTWEVAQQMLPLLMKIYKFDYTPVWINEYNDNALYEWENDEVVISIKRI
jgi:hypothetical protein